MPYFAMVHRLVNAWAPFTPLLLEKVWIRMGIFERLFPKSDPIKMTLLDEYAVAFSGMCQTPSEARAMARDFVAKAEAEVIRRGWSNEPANYGDALLCKEATDSEIHERLDLARADGVTDDDIRWWWNMPALERVLIEQSDELNRTSAFINALRQGLEPEIAAKRVFAIHPKFGNPADGDGDDRPLPIELKRRIVVFIERHYTSPEMMRQKIADAASFNAIVRAEVRAKNL